MAPPENASLPASGDHKVACCRCIAVIYPDTGLPSGAIACRATAIRTRIYENRT